jgi:hypothetical protein
MKAAIIFTGSGPILVVTTCEELSDCRVLRQLAGKAGGKFLGFEVPIETVRQRYGNHFDVVCENLIESDELRVVDENGDRVLSKFRFEELGAQFQHEPAEMSFPYAPAGAGSGMGVAVPR